MANIPLCKYTNFSFLNKKILKMCFLKVEATVMKTDKRNVAYQTTELRHGVCTLFCEAVII